MQTSEEKLGSQPLGKLMVSMAVPAVTAQFINVLYNIVDRIYIGHIAGYGDLALHGSRCHLPHHHPDLRLQRLRGNGRSAPCLH